VRKYSPEVPSSVGCLAQVCANHTGAVQEYLEAYVKHFDLLSHIQLQTKVLRITHNDADNNWTIHLKENHLPEAYVNFDKVVICSGEWGSQECHHFPVEICLKDMSSILENSRNQATSMAKM
jgi:hypothetical protein